MNYVCPDLSGRGHWEYNLGSSETSLWITSVLIFQKGKSNLKEGSLLEIWQKTASEFEAFMTENVISDNHCCFSKYHSTFRKVQFLERASFNISFIPSLKTIIVVYYISCCSCASDECSSKLAFSLILLTSFFDTQVFQTIHIEGVYFRELE